MYRFKQSLMALMGVVTLVVIVTVTMPHIGRGASGSGTTSSAPTSQTQNVNVVNTPSVNAQQSGTWNVGINGTPVVGLDAANNTVKFDAVNNTVKIDTTNPLPVRDVDNPARQPVQAAGTAGAGETNHFFSVPLGKVLVIEHVSADVRGMEDNALLVLGTNAGSGGVFQDVPLTKQKFGNEVLLVASQPIRAYAVPGTSVSFTVNSPLIFGQGDAHVTISGYLVNVP